MTKSNKTCMVLGSRSLVFQEKCWEEHLTISNGQQKTFLIATAGYSALADANEFFNIETETFDLPKTIGNLNVVGIKDNYIIGGDIWINADAQGYEFDTIDKAQLERWLEENKWTSIVDIDTIEKLITCWQTNSLNTRI